MKKILFSCLIGFLGLNTFGQSDIIMFGHLYPYLRNKSCLEKLDQALNVNAAKLFIDLGDEQDEWVQSNKNKLGNKYVFVPGNHDFKSKNKNFYGDAVQLFKHQKWWVIKLISSYDVATINKGLADLMQDYQNENCIVVAHHRIWNDSLLGDKSFHHDKSYLANEVQFGKLNVKAIFAGNSNKQYMQNNPNYVAWVDWWNNIPCYNIGSGHVYQHGVTLAKITLNENDLYVQYEKIACEIEIPKTASKATFVKINLTHILLMLFGVGLLIMLVVSEISKN